MADDEAAGLRLCRADALAERGDAYVFDVLHHGESATAFVLRFEGRPVGYLNRCAHVAAEMDWLPGRFLDSEREFILCSIHGASYDPRNGRCAGGPCGRASLVRVEVAEVGEEVRWYPSRDTRPAPSAPPACVESRP